MRIYEDKDGYIYYEYSKYDRISKHRFIYEQKYGKIGDSEVIIFLNGNKRDFSLSNLYKLQRKELVVLNRWYGGISSDPKETLLRINIIKVKQKRIELARKAGLVNAQGNISEDVRRNSARWLKNHPEYQKKNNERIRLWRQKRMKDPLYREEYNRKQRERRAKRLARTL